MYSYAVLYSSIRAHLNVRISIQLRFLFERHSRFIVRAYLIAIALIPPPNGRNTLS